MDKMKMLAFAMVGFIVVTVFAGSVNADITNDPDSALEVGDTNVDDITVYRGETISFYIYVVNTGYEDVYHCNVSISNTVLDGDEKVVESPFLKWNTQAVNDDATIYGEYYYYNGHYFYGFSSTVKPSAQYGEYWITAIITYKDSYGNNYSTQSKISFYIGRMVNIYGDIDACPKETSESLNLYTAYDSYYHREIQDVYLNVTRPDNDFVFSGENPSTGVAHTDLVNGTWSPAYTLSVLRTKAIGAYAGKANLEYSYNGFRISDTFNISFVVRPNPILNISYDVQDFNRNKGEISLNISVSNAGNVDLMNIKFWIDEKSGDYFEIPEHIWEYNGDEPMFSDGMISLKNVSVGENKTVKFYAVMDPHTPVCTHKILLDYSAKYEYENRTYTTGEHWSNGNPVWTGVSACMDKYIMKKGYSLKIRIKGDMPDFDFVYADGGIPNVSSSLGHSILMYHITNNEYRSYSDVKIYIKTSSSPFINPENDSDVWFLAGRMKEVDSEGNCNLNLVLKDDALAGYYEVPVRVDAVDMLSGEKVSSQHAIPIIIRGNGAKLLVENKKITGTVRPESYFKVNVTIKNMGDDIAQNILITLPDSTYFKVISGQAYIYSLSPGEKKSVEFTCVGSAAMKPSSTYTQEMEISYSNKFGKSNLQEEDTIGVSSDSYVTVSGMGVILSAAFILMLLVAAYVGLLMWSMWKHMSEKPPKKKKGRSSKTPTKKKTSDKNKKMKKQQKKPMKKTPDKSEKEELETFGDEYEDFIPEIDDV